MFWKNVKKPFVTFLFFLLFCLIFFKSCKKSQKFYGFLNSAYYFPVSKGFGNNSIAFILSGNDVEDEVSPIVLHADNGTHQIQITVELERIVDHRICRIIPRFGIAELLPNLNSVYFLDQNFRSQPIPFRVMKSPMPSRDVVFCISPLFFNEQWQNLIFAFHIYKHFSAFIHLYVMSTRTSIFKLLQEYERKGYLSIQPWIAGSVGSNYANFKQELEYRGQAASHTDCLIQYKDSTKFISFLDPDDVLIPKFSSFYEEFTEMFGVSQQPLFLSYPKHNHRVTVDKNGQTFSIFKMAHSVVDEHISEYGKMVLKPSRHNHTWIHWPNDKHDIPKGLKIRNNAIFHLKTIDWQNTADSSENSEPSIIPLRHLQKIEADFQLFSKPTSTQKLLKQLPTSTFFTQLFLDCYNQKIRNRVSCGSFFVCSIPPSSHRCSKAVATIYSDHIRQNFFFATDVHFISHTNCTI